MYDIKRLRKVVMLLKTTINLFNYIDSIINFTKFNIIEKQAFLKNKIKNKITMNFKRIVSYFLWHFILFFFQG